MKISTFGFLFIALTLFGCEPNLSDEDLLVLNQMALFENTPLPLSPTNKYADNLQAADLGRTIFFDKAMSSDGSTACGSCHMSDQGWSDDREVSLGVADAMGGRHSMPAHTIAFQNFFFWDGRADSAWSQTLQAIESEAEMNFPREDVAQYVVDHRLDAYETVFGPIPTNFLENEDSVNRIFANVGKALEAYQRRLVCSNTMFDQWMNNEIIPTAQQETGAQIFVEQGCTNCHSGPAFSDGLFHELGVENQSDDDSGRKKGLQSLLDNPFNGVGQYSDDTEFGNKKLMEAMNEEDVDDAFKTPTLRGVAQRGRFSHGGKHNRLADFLNDTYNDDNNNVDIELNDGQADDVVVFLKMLNCNEVPQRWGTPENFEP